MYIARRPRRSSVSRDRILAAVRSLLEEGVFHETTVEQVAERAGVSRATLYGHFRSRLGLVDAICESFDANPALMALRTTRDLDLWFERVVEFWSSEENVLLQLYGAAAVDPAARDLVERQTRDRYNELRKLLTALDHGDPDALAALAILSSFETYLELRRRLGMPKQRVVTILQQQARSLLGAPKARHKAENATRTRQSRSRTRSIDVEPPIRLADRNRGESGRSRSLQDRAGGRVEA